MQRRLFAAAVTATLLSSSPGMPGSAAELPAPPPVLPPVPDLRTQIREVPAPLPSVSIVGANGPFVGVSLDTAISMALAQNQDLQLSEASHRIAGYHVVADRGPFDVNFIVEPVLSRSVQPAISPFSAGPGGGPTTTGTAALTGGFEVTTLGGTSLSLTANATRTESNSTSNAYDPFYQTAISFNVTQPLGSGRYSKERRDLALAINSTRTASANTLITASNTITAVIDAYWDLVAAWRNLGIQEQALAQATAQSRSNARLVRRGSAAPVDVVESNTQVDVDQDNVYSALQNVASLENRLKGLILLNPADGLWQVNLVPTSPVAEVPPEPDLRSLIVAGLVNRPEFEIVAAQLRNAKIQRAFARDESRPQMNLQLGISENGFAGQNGLLSQNPFFTGFTPLYTTINQLITAANATLPAGSAPIPSVTAISFANPASMTGRWGTSWNSLLNGSYPVYSAQLNIALPLRNDRGRGDLAVAREQEHMAQVQEEQYVARLIMDARNAVQAYDAARQRLISAHAARLAADRVLLGEQRRFAVGRSTTFLVLQRQIEDANNEGRELQAQTDLNKSIAELDRVSGALYAKHGIHVQMPSQGVIDQRIHEAGLTPVIAPSPSSTPQPPLAIPEATTKHRHGHYRTLENQATPTPAPASSPAVTPPSSLPTKSPLMR